MAQQIGVIILGDAGLNFWLNKRDIKEKEAVSALGYKVYCVRGNHEERPERISSMVLVYDEDVKGHVWLEYDFPNIRYFRDGDSYIINGLRTLVLGGAYSVDKEYRLSRKPAGASWSGWFAGEQLSDWERNEILATRRGEAFDLILSHTCPISWEPTDLFLDFIDQDKVDKSTELWLEEVKNSVAWKLWLFGHYHDNRLVRPGVEMLYMDIEELDNIVDRWEENRPEDFWYLRKDPKYYQGV